MATGNVFLNAGKRDSAVLAAMDKKSREAIKNLNEQIKLERKSEKRGIERLNAFMEAGKDIPMTELSDGTSSNNAKVIREDINARTGIAVRKLESQIDEIYEQTRIRLGDRVNQVMAESAEKFADKAGQAARPVVQSAVKFGKKFWDRAKKPIQSSKEHLLEL